MHACIAMWLCLQKNRLGCFLVADQDDLVFEYHILKSLNIKTTTAFVSY